MKVAAALVLPGSGTRIPSLIGAFEVIDQHADVVAVGGSSGGGIVALAIAAGLSPLACRELCARLLTRKDLLDKNLFGVFGGALGIHKGERIYQLLLDVFGQRRMGELHIPCRVTACDLWTRRGIVVDTHKDPDVLVADAARCTMAIPLFFEPWRLRANDARTYVDGGTTNNVPAGLWDDLEGTPTVVVKFRSSEEPRPVRDPAALAAALFDLRQDAADCSMPSRKPKHLLHEVVIDSDADGLAFGLSHGEVERRRRQGALAATRWAAS